MEELKIVDFTQDWRCGLRDYMRKTFPEYSDSYIDYCLDNSTGTVPSKLVVTGNGEVVGCHLYYCTKAMINGEEVETQWGHDTYLDEEYRKIIGVDFAIVRRDIPAFGVGLTDVNKKMSKLMKRIFLKGTYLYYALTPWIIFSPFQKMFHLNNAVAAGESIKVKGKVYRRVTDVRDLDIPNGGYWYKDCHNLDFKRDKEFLERRFLKCKVHEYILYSSGNSYFVVRKSSYRGMPAIMLSDFRYDPKEENSITYLMHAVRKFAIKSHVGIVRFVCGDSEVEDYMKGRLHHKTPLDFITSYKDLKDATYTLCGGDSDADFVHS